MPRLDPAMQSGKVVEWLKKPGEKVAKGEAILVVEGEKTTFEVESPAEGVLRKTLYEVGDDVPVTTVVAYVGTPDESIPEPPSGPPKEAPSSPLVIPQATKLQETHVAASPAARKLAQESGIRLESIVGTGPGGRITREDVIAAASGSLSMQALEVKAGAPRQAKRLPLSGVRKAVAERLAYSARTAVPVALTAEVDMSGVAAWRKTQGSGETGISITAILVKATAKALQLHPELNSTLEGEDVINYADVNVAVAINTKDGLVAPVVRDASGKGLADVSKEMEKLAEKAEKKELEVADVTGGTFTVTNLGGYGVDLFVPTINPPQCAILAMGRTAERPVVVHGSIASRPTATLTLVFDHRITDGLPAARFLQTVKTLLEKMDIS